MPAVEACIYAGRKRRERLIITVACQSLVGRAALCAPRLATGALQRLTGRVVPRARLKPNAVGARTFLSAAAPKSHSALVPQPLPCRWEGSGCEADFCARRGVRREHIRHIRHGSVSAERRSPCAKRSSQHDRAICMVAAKTCLKIQRDVVFGAKTVWASFCRSAHFVFFCQRFDFGALVNNPIGAKIAAKSCRISTDHYIAASLDVSGGEI